MPNNSDAEFNTLVQERFQKLPKVVQNAIQSADVSKRLQELANTYHLHVDQWQALENEVHYTLLGIDLTDDLVANLKKELEVDDATAAALADVISKNVFEPVRLELEHELATPPAAVTTETPAAMSAPAQSAPQTTPTETSAPMATPTGPRPTVASIVPATPPAAKPTEKVERAPISATYTAATPSHERKAIEGDPYREQVS